jgi:uncharacterized protein (DUF58 family)
MTVPTRRLALLLLGLFPVALLPALVSPASWRAWVTVLALVGLAALADLVFLPPRLEVRATAPASMYVGDHAELTLAVQGGGTRPLPLRLLVDLEPPLQPAPEQVGSLRPGTEARFPLHPERRGKGRASAAWLRVCGPFGLLERLFRRPLALEVAVLPDLRPTRAAALRFLARRDFRTGPRVARYVGEGSEFEALVEFGPGLDPRAIDWKATARRRRLLAREYRAERNRPLVLALDTGHLMSEPLGAVPRLDHAIASALLLAHVALRSGDRVGLFAFDEKPRVLLQPTKGPRTFRRIQQETAGLAYGSGETNFTLGLLELRRRLTRRALVVVLTDFVDPVSAELMCENVGRLAVRHLVLFVALRDALLEQTAGAPPSTEEALARAVVARDLLREREAVLLRLRRRGVLCLDVTPEQMGTAVVNRYLGVRRRELL